MEKVILRIKLNRKSGNNMFYPTKLNANIFQVRIKKVN